MGRRITLVSNAKVKMFPFDHASHDYQRKYELLIRDNVALAIFIDCMGEHRLQ